MEKDAAIIELLQWLRQQLGNSFMITDHWEGDLSAVGISSPDDPSQLVYMLSFGRPAGRYAVELESVPVAGSDLPFRSIAKFDLVSRKETLDRRRPLLNCIAAHDRVFRLGAGRIKLGDVPRYLLAPGPGGDHFAAAWRDRDYLQGTGRTGEPSAEPAGRATSAKSSSVKRGAEERPGLRHLHRSGQFHP